MTSLVSALLDGGFFEIDLGTLRYGWRGVYVLFNRRNEIIYVGQGNVGSRVRDHNHRSSRTKWKRAFAIAFTQGQHHERLALEAELIRLLKPKRNVSRGAFRRRCNHPVVSLLAQPSLFDGKAA